MQRVKPVTVKAVRALSMNLKKKIAHAILTRRVIGAQPPKRIALNVGGKMKMNKPQNHESEYSSWLTGF